MKVETALVEYKGIEPTINEVGWENVLQIIPCGDGYASLFVIIYKSKKKKDRCGK